jgi:RHH-type transcriptional regulator, rel operon repressor / antitoxin RelB
VNNSSTTITVRLQAKVKQRLEALARSTRRSKSFLAAEAIAAYVDANAWQTAETEKALKEADAGDFATEAEVDAVFRKWGG